MKKLLKQIPTLGVAAKRIVRRFLGRKRQAQPFSGSAEYWENRYQAGGNSGVGSYARFAEFKAEVLNGFVAAHAVRTVIEFGCGDGNQLRLAQYPSYVGFDVSSTAVSKCRKLFKSDVKKSFRLVSEYHGETADLTLSLDVVYHLVEDEVFERYMHTLFAAAERWVIVYASDSDDNRGYAGTHVRHRKITKWIAEALPSWKLIEHVPNRYPYQGNYRKGSFSEFFIYEKA